MDYYEIMTEVNRQGGVESLADKLGKSRQNMYHHLRKLKEGSIKLNILIAILDKLGLEIVIRHK